MNSPANADFVTYHQFELAMARIDARFDQLDARMQVRFAETEARMEVGFAETDAKIERVLAASIRWTVGVSFGLYALMFGLILFVVTRELPHT